MGKNIKSNRVLLLFYYVLASLLNLLLLIVIKYKNQTVPLSEINLLYPGNILNLISGAFLIFGLFWLYFSNSWLLNSRLLLSSFLMNNLLLALCFIMVSVQLPFRDFYLMGLNGNKFLIALMFTTYNFTFFVLIFISWSEITKTKNLILLRSFLNSALLMTFILVIVFIFILISETKFKSINYSKDKNTIGVVLGAAVWSKNKPSPSLAARVDKAIELYKSNKLKSIYLTGSNAPYELSEAEVALRYLKERDSTIKNVYKEEKTTSTTEQINFIKSELIPDNHVRILLISDSYHLVRISQIAKFHQVNVDVIPSDLRLSFESQIYNKIREALALTVFWFFAV